MDKRIVYSPKSWLFNINISQLLLVALFYVFLSPFAIELGKDGVNANFLYVFFPIFVVAITGKVNHPGQKQLIFIFIYIVIFIVSTLYQSTYLVYFWRRFASFLIFMSIFTYIFIRINMKMVQAFKISIVIISLKYSFDSIYTFFLMSGNELGYSMKAIVGSQRYGFVLLLSIWIVYKYSIKISKSALIVKYTIILILSSGILLTFSRSGIISLIASIVLYVLFNNLRTFKVFRKNNFKISVNTIVTIFMVIIILILFNIFLSAPLNFYWERLFELLLNMRFDALSLQSNLSSGGYRIFMITKILDFIFINPFTGSGYLGVWIMFDDLSGSAHSQYFDVLFRTGIFGFMIYSFLLNLNLLAVGMESIFMISTYIITKLMQWVYTLVQFI